MSIVIPTYNNADYVDETMRSVLAQTYSDVEIVIADHMSTDDTWDRLQAYAAEPNVTLLRTEAGGGALRNWNRVTEAATGEYLKLVCADDVIYPTCLAEQVAALSAVPEAVAAASPRDILDAAGKVVVAKRGLAGLSGVVDGVDVIRRTVRCGTNLLGEPVCVLFRRQVLVDLGGWDSRFPYLIDQATYANALLHGPLVVVPNSLAGFRVNGAQLSVRLAGEQAQQAAKYHRAFQADHPDVLSPRDVRIGNIRAVGVALMRRTAYAYLRRRMNAPAERSTEPTRPE